MISESLFPTHSLWWAAVLAAPILLWAVLGVPWQRLQEHKRAQHVFFLFVLVVAGAWHLDAGILPGLHFHLLGMTAATLLMGWRLALVAGLFIQCVLVASGKLWWAALPMQWLTSVAVPVFASYGGWWLVNRYFPKNPFVYLILGCFFNAVAAQVLANLAQVFALWWCDVYSVEKMWENYLYLLPLMLFPEGVINGMFITAMVVFHSRWVSTFDEQSYFSS